jgi:hypothetical protein
MRKYLIGGLITITILGLFSYKTTDGGNTYANSTVFNIPLKQKQVITTDDIKKVNKLVKCGYIVQFVTENHYNGSSRTNTTYTLIAY